MEHLYITELSIHEQSGKPTIQEFGPGQEDRHYCLRHSKSYAWGKEITSCRIARCFDDEPGAILGITAAQTALLTWAKNNMRTGR